MQMTAPLLGVLCTACTSNVGTRCDQVHREYVMGGGLGADSNPHIGVFPVRPLRPTQVVPVRQWTTLRRPIHDPCRNRRFFVCGRPPFANLVHDPHIGTCRSGGRRFVKGFDLQGTPPGTMAWNGLALQVTEPLGGPVGVGGGEERGGAVGTGGLAGDAVFAFAGGCGATGATRNTGFAFAGGWHLVYVVLRKVKEMTERYKRGKRREEGESQWNRQKDEPV